MSRMRIADVNDKVEISNARLRNFEKRQKLINWLFAGMVATTFLLHFVI